MSSSCTKRLAVMAGLILAAATALVTAGPIIR